MSYKGMQYSDALTLQGIKQDIYFLGHCSSASIGDDDLLRIINKYYFQLQEVVRQVNENFYMQIATADLTDPTLTPFGSYTYPDGTGTAPVYEKIKSIMVAVNPADPTAPLDSEFEKVLCVDPQQISDPSYQFEQPTAIMFGDYFELKLNGAKSYPVTGGIKTYYIAENNELVNDVDVPKIFPSFHDAITQGALIDVAERLRNDKLKADSVALFKKRLEEIRNYASDRFPQEQGLVENQSGAGGWVYPWGDFNSSI